MGGCEAYESASIRNKNLYHKKEVLHQNQVLQTHNITQLSHNNQSKMETMNHQIIYKNTNQQQQELICRIPQQQNTPQLYKMKHVYLKKQIDQPYVNQNLNPNINSTQFQQPFEYNYQQKVSKIIPTKNVNLKESYSSPNLVIQRGQQQSLESISTLWNKYIDPNEVEKIELANLEKNMEEKNEDKSVDFSESLEKKQIIEIEQEKGCILHDQISPHFFEANELTLTPQNLIKYEKQLESFVETERQILSNGDETIISKKEIQSEKRQEYMEDGSFYEGEFFKNQRNGYGILIHNDKTKYIGQFIENEKSGFGIQQWEDGREYKGQWKFNQMNGQGTFHWPDGNQISSIYEGEYLNGYQSGLGKLKWADGREYYGNWLEGKQNGFGYYKFVTGSLVKGFWQNGERVLKGLQQIELDNKKANKVIQQKNFNKQTPNAKIQSNRTQRNVTPNVKVLSNRTQMSYFSRNSSNCSGIKYILNLDYKIANSVKPFKEQKENIKTQLKNYNFSKKSTEEQLKLLLVSNQQIQKKLNQKKIPANQIQKLHFLR